MQSTIDAIIEYLGQGNESAAMQLLFDNHPSKVAYIAINVYASLAQDGDEDKADNFAALLAEQVEFAGYDV